MDFLERAGVQVGGNAADGRLRRGQVARDLPHALTTI